MAEEKCFCWLNGVTKPCTEVIIVNASLEALSVQLDHDLKQCEVKVLLLRGSKILSKRLRCDIPNMIIINGKKGLSNRVEIDAKLGLQLCLKLLDLLGDLLRLHGA